MAEPRVTDESPQGALTSAGLMRMVERAVASRLPGVVTAGRSKFELLTLLERERGARAVVEVGLGFRDLPRHPVFDALESGASPEQILARWRRLEVFGHTRHRTRVVASEEQCVVVEHYDVAGDAVGRVNDLFVWGLLVALLERARVVGVEARLDGAAGTLLVEAGAAHDVPEHVVATARLCLRWTSHEAASPRVETENVTERDARDETRDPAAHGSIASPSARLGALVEQDPMRIWQVDEVAKLFGQSSRALQRALAGEGTTFSETILRARVDAARRLLDESALTPTEIAFCVGFADAAHFSRVFRRFNEIPPTAYRGLRADVAVKDRSRPRRAAGSRPSSSGRAPS